MVVLCCIVVVTGFLPFPVSRSSLSSPPSQVIFYEKYVKIIYERADAFIQECLQTTSPLTRTSKGHLPIDFALARETWRFS